MLKALTKPSDGLTLNRLEKHDQNPCNGYKRLVHLMQSDKGQSMGSIDRPCSTIDRVDRPSHEGKRKIEKF